jgi:Holliday junction resolvasome RuvABC endonuclease subunit
MKSILALDLGTRSGWAIRDRQGVICSGSQSFKPQRFEGGGMRFLRFQRWLKELVAPNGGDKLIDLIVFEEVRRHLGVDAAHAYGGFMAQLCCTCETMKIPYEGVPVATIKRHATGKGNASKELMIGAIKALGYNPVDDNEADALALLHWAMDQS